MTRKQENENKRTEILKKIWALIESEGDEVIQIKKNEIAIVKESADNEAASCNVIGSNPTKASSFL